MKTFQVDATNDFILDDSGDLALISGLTAIGQTSVQYVKARRGEMIHQVDEGIPYDLVAWMGEPNETQFEAVIRARLMQVPDVTAVVDFEVVMVGSTLSYTATLETSEGETTING